MPALNLLPTDTRGLRLDHAVHAMLRAQGREVSVREVKDALRRGEITVDGRRVPPGRAAQGGETVEWAGFVARSEAVLEPRADPRVSVIDNADDVLVLAKPAGMPTHPLRPAEDGTLLHAAVAVRPEVGRIGPPLEGGLVHRLDIGTSGVVVFATTEASRDMLREAFRVHRVIKTYLALTRPPSWRTRHATERIDGTGPRVRVLPADAGDGLPAATTLTTKRVVDDRAWVQAETRTGRRHQVRAHLSHHGAPLWGDPTYDGPPADRLGLHASRIELPDGRRFDSPLPPDLTALLEAP